MKFLLLICLLPISAFGARKITIDEVTKTVKTQNLVVLQNAEKVYQAKLSIEAARRGMLVNLNLWTLGKVIIEPTSIIEVAQEIAPFLVPANWFRMKETEKLYAAEKAGYAALQSNEVYQARSLYFQIQLDQDLLITLVKYEKELSDALAIAEDRRDLGFDNAELAREIRIHHINVIEDVEKLKVLTEIEKRAFKEALGINLEEELILERADLKNDLKKIDPNSWTERMLSKSPELFQLDQFIAVLPYIKNEMRFSILGVPSISRGTSGGVFDDIPESQGLGFGTGKQMAIVDSKGDVLKLQKKAIEETLKRQLFNLADEFNSNLSLFSLQKERLILNEENFLALKEKLSLGGEVSLADFSNGINNLLQAFALYSEAKNSFSMSLDKLDRLTFSHAYEDLQVSVPAKVEQRDCKKNIFGKVVCK